MKTKIFQVALVGVTMSLGACEPAPPADDQRAAEQARQLFASPALPELSELAAPAAPSVPAVNAKKLRMPTPKGQAVDPEGSGAAEACDCDGEQKGTQAAWDKRFRGFETVAEEFPWGNAEDGIWTGTGHPDPDDFKKYTDEEILGLASVVGDKSGTRMAAVVSAGRRKIPGAVAVIQQALSPKEPEIVRTMAISALIEHGGTEALSLMWQAQSDDPSPHVRGGAVWAIALYGPHEALRGVEAGWADEHPAVKGLSILALTAVRNESRVRHLLQQAIDSDEQLVWQESAYVLGQIPATWARQMLATAYDNAKGQKRTALRASLKRALADNFGRVED